MSLTISLQSALASLNATQGAMQVVSNNVANATTEGFTKKTISTQTQIVAGRASGVRLSDIQRVVDQNLLRQIREQLAKVEDLSVRNDYYGRIQDLFGSPGSDSDIAHLLTEFGSSVESLATTPESAPGKYDAVAVAVQFTDRLNSLSAEIQEMRREVDRNISDTVSLVNTKLNTINDLNNQISLAFGQQQSAADLEDARDKVMAELSELIEIETFDRSNGHVVVFTSSGRPLIDNGVVSLSHTAVAQFDASISYPGNVSGIVYGAGSVDITNEIANGRLSGLIEMRDQRLVELQEEYDEITETMVNAVNAAHNAGSSFPAPVSLTSTRSLASGDNPGMSGTFRVSVLDTNGTVVETSDIALGGLADIGALVTAIDGMTNVTASLNTNGKLVVSATGGNRIAINEMTSAVTTGNETTGLAQFLGLNDLMTLDTDYTRYTSVHQASGTAAMGLTGTLTFSHPGGTTAVAYTATESLTTIAANISAALAAQNIDASVLQENGRFRLSMNDTDGGNFFVTDSSNFMSTVDLRAGQPGASSLVAVRSDIIADPNLISTGEISSSGTLAVGDVAISAGDSTALNALAGVFSADQTLSAAGALPVSTMSLADYAASIVSLNSTQASDVAAQFDVQDSYRAALTTKSANLSQVNIDEEMSSLMILQNAYQASARVTQTVSEMMDTLIGIIR